MKRFVAMTIAVLMIFSMFGCGKEEPPTVTVTETDDSGNVVTDIGGNVVTKEVESGTYMLSFSQAQSVKAMKEMDGKEVQIIGYMSTLSPISGQFMYLMNLPYQNCPFCIPNTNELANTMAVYAPKNSEFKFTDRAITVTGILEFGDWTDEFGYEYSYRIKDASYTILDTDDMSEELKLWQQLAATNVIADVYAMYDYVNFLCFWPQYTARFGPEDSDRDYLYADDVPKFLSGQFGYGEVEGYFTDMIARIEEVDTEAFKTLVENIRKTEELAEEAKQDYASGKYKIVDEYSHMFDDGRKQYRMDNFKSFDLKFESLYRGFASWLAEWEI